MHEIDSLNVLILPMRNGNRDTLAALSLAWTVLILPMRNGNYKERKNTRSCIKVLILPMRNGNKKHLIELKQST